MATTKDTKDRDRTAAQEASEKAEADKAEQQRVADTQEAQRRAADPETEFRDGEYEVLQPIEHDQKRYVPAAPGQQAVKVKLTGKQAEQLAGVGAIKVPK